MRPAKLELEGFASFREPTMLDLEGADLFVLAGPTGAGKSSLIDAMVFALYGSVPRYDDRRLVAPVISQGHQQARVRFTFELNGDRLTATRVVRRTKTGATTKEARLERGSDGKVLAGTADELTSEIERRIGLGFDHFTRTVVLPQGEFQEFLHAKPSQRQDLLVQLLDLDVYQRVARRANQRAKDASTTAGVLRKQLEEDLGDATEIAVESASQRVATLEELAERCDEAVPRLESLIEAGKEARRRADAATTQLAAVTDVGVPDGVVDLHDQLAAAADELTETQTSLESARADLEAATAAADDLPSPEALKELEQRLEQRQHLAAKLAEARDRASSATSSATNHREALERAVATEKQTAEALRRLEHQHLAHTLREDLDAGQPCPVCRQPVTSDLDKGAPPDDLATARERLSDAEAAVTNAREQATAVERAASSARSTVASLEEQIAELDRQLEGRATALRVELQPDAVTARREEAQMAQAALAKARQAVSQAERALRDATERRESLTSRGKAAWQEFDATRDRLAGALAPHTPPTADRDDLGGSWKELVGWVREQRPAIEEAAETARAAIEDAERAYKRQIDALIEALEERDVEVEGRSPDQITKAVTSALVAARAAKERAAERLEEAGRARKKLEEADRQAALAGELGKLLNARNFEQWLLNRALRHLVVGASTILRELTNEAYSLAVSDDGSFEVIDHRNADEVRSARTLSGGETFLASLSLALSLAEHVTELATHGSARLDALFLDEGFGTLDAETLDTVAAAIEELGATGRMVGLVTHVRDLAERVPVRFEVRKTAATSTVERIER
ncbi:MAG: SMC family ATPase [Nitriliruptorales bacterium]|nr:SMC family ATPase [Nitriliruptorales bacterium]